ncbi:MAG: efflux RND transporter permease subunit [Nitrospirae bacterium]|nr:MAG: efflux RND transporter permease subunit [Nitrospirota bacterium]
MHTAGLQTGNSTQGKPLEPLVIVRAAQEVGKPLFFSLLIITVSFLPVFMLEAQEGRLFRPLAATKTFAMLFASIASVTLGPLLMILFIRGRIHGEERNPLSWLLVRIYRPVVQTALRMRWLVFILAMGGVIWASFLFAQLGSEFMPPLNEGTILYMPTALPGISVEKAIEVLQVQDRLLKAFPEVDHVFGKMGRARTPTDPAPLSMAETVVTLKPRDQWRPGMTWDRLIEDMDQRIRLPGMPNIWWMPIQTRTEMLATGIRSSLGILIYGPKLEEIERIGLKIEKLLKHVPGTRSVYAERVTGGYYVDIQVNREAAARYGLTVGDVQEVIESAIGGKNISFTIEGRERYPINVRYPRELRQDLEALQRVVVKAPTGEYLPLGQVAEFSITTGPPSIRDENGALAGIVFVDVAGRDLGTYVQEVQTLIRQQVPLPPGYSLGWGGQYRYLERAKAKLAIAVPLTIGLIFVLLYLNFRSISRCILVLVSLPFSLIGAVWYLYYLDYNVSVAVWVGIIALLGVATEIGVLVVVYLDQAVAQRQAQGRLNTWADLRDAVVEGASLRVRPIMMTASAVIGGLFPIMWSHGAGADVMQRIAAPMIGGMVTTTMLTLIVLPALYLSWSRFTIEVHKPEMWTT